MDYRITVENRSPETADAFSQRNRRSGGLKSSCPPPERRSTISSVMPCIYQNTMRLRNLSGGSTTSGSSTNSTQLDNHYFSSDNGINCSSTVQANRSNSSPSSHKKLDRSWSDSDNDRNVLHRSVNSSRYKTELCRPFEESGSCKYGDKCQFAHGYHELRNLARHPKYKTELCRTFHTVGFCPYGPRCHFIHEEEIKPEASPKLARSGSVQSSSGSSSPTLSPPSTDDLNIFNYQNDPLSLSSLENHQFSAPLSVNINNCGSYSNNFDQALKQLSLLNMNRNNCIDVFNSGSSKEPKMIGADEHDIFSEVTMFRAEDLDNAPKQTTTCAMQSMRLDNFSSAVQWNKENIFQMMRPVDPFHHSPTGSDGSSSGSSSDCGGSTESLASNGFTEWRCPEPIGQY